MAATVLLRATAATCQRSEEAAIPQEIARRLWLLHDAMVKSLNVVRLQPPEEHRSRLQPLQQQADRAVNGSGTERLGSKSLEQLFEDFVSVIRRAASP